MPKKMEQLLALLDKKIMLSDATLSTLHPWEKSFVLKQSDEVLFEKVDGRHQALAIVDVQPSIPAASMPEISIQEFSAVYMVVGTIIQAEVVEKSDKLLKLQVNCGIYGKRQILAGVKMYYKPEELVGQQGIFVVNLKPRALMGLESQGMMLLAGGEKRPELIRPQASVADGTRIS